VVLSSLYRFTSAEKCNNFADKSRSKFFFFIVAVVTDSLTDVDKVLIHLEAKDYTVEHMTLQSLQQLIQWVADLAVNILARLPEQRLSGRPSGVI